MSGRYWVTGNPLVGTALIIQGAEGPTAVPSDDGGDIVFTLDGASGEEMQLTFFDLAEDVTITLNTETDPEAGGTSTTVPVVADPSGGLQSIEIDISLIKQVIVTFTGRGAIASVGICRDPNTPPPMGNNSPSATLEPTSMPTTSPAPTETPGCPEDIVLVASVGHTLPPRFVITIIEQTTDTVTFEVTQKFNKTVSRVFTQYHETPAGETECFEDDNVPYEETQRHTAYCMHCVPLTIVDLWFSDPTLEPTLDNAIVPPCCHPPTNETYPTVQYTFKLYCETKCPPDGEPNQFQERRLLEAPEEPVEVEAEAITDIAPAQEEEDDSKHACSSKDHPCNGDMVYVCHYSSRHGYQTYCVPEADSDIVEFYPKSYCGRCTGGQGNYIRE